MNFKIVLPLLLFTVNFALGQNTALKNPELLNKTLKKDSIIAEFSELYHLTNTIHPGQFMFCSQNEFDKTYSSLKSSIKTDLSLVEYYKLTATLMAKIKDGHTAVDRGRIIGLLNDRLVFPFSIYKIKDHYYLDKSSPENKEYAGLRILKINGKDIHAVVNEMKQYIHLEGRNETGLNARFSNFPFYYFIYNQTEKFEIEYADRNNHKLKGIFKGMPFKEYTGTISKKAEPLTTEFRTNDLAVLKFRSFENGYNEAERKIAEKQLDRFFTQLDSLKTKNLIIDLRDNSGGSADIANYLFSYLSSTPYYYLDYMGAKYKRAKEWKHYAQYPDNIDEINLNETKLKDGLNCYTETNSADWWFKLQQNKPNFYKGKISVLINGGCFSTTGHLLALMREYKIGKLYGEYSQGSNYSNAGGQAFVLPYSKTLVWIPTFQYRMRTPNFKTDPKGIKPDVEIEIQPNDLQTKFDRPMDFVIERIGKNI
ncbi:MULTISPECIES: S41 family peptidase [unclassified Chryseobacterium]|uniref:S41 family peptidase n=1 Tax=unclassified Chryseobacterium TaxID=2593645 RepID=UPI00100A6FE4|nr:MULTISPECIES: S41 family peptidase [unclassified Chryseobacterium]RXM50552.1 peptidase S41 [Chryseobacterium sp. CH25]RXM63188.1 peptidase S41 [Chryseobacterium sp. CH1]